MTAIAASPVFCWFGPNGFDQLTELKMMAPTPVMVTGIDNAIAVTAGSDHTCALLSGGGIRCWGANYSGQLGDGTKTPSFVPVTVVERQAAAP